MNNKIYITYYTVAAIIFLSSRALAQGSVQYLSLSTAIQAALSNNTDIKLAKLEESVAQAKYKQTESFFLPQADLSYTAMTTNDPLNSFGFKLNQRTISQNDFDPGLLNHPGGTPNYNAKVEVQQPLLNVDWLYMRKGAQMQIEAYQYKTQRAKEYLTFEVQKAYLQLKLAYDAEKVLKEGLQHLQSVYTFTENRFKQGLIQKSDLLNAQVQVATVESNLVKTRSNVRSASDYLGMLMGQKSGTIYTVADALIAEPIIDTTQQVPASRSDFMAMDKVIIASGLMIKSTQMSFLPKLNAFGNYQYNDSHLTGFGANSYFAGMQLSWDVFKGNKIKNAVTLQKLERDKLTEQLAQQKDQSQVELKKAYRDITDAQSDILRDNATIQQADESLRILQNRYQQGLVNTTDVLMAETQLSQQKFALAQAKFAFNLTGYYIRFLTSTSTK